MVYLEIAEEDKKEICNLHDSGMGSKKIDKLPQFAKKDYGYNRIQRLFKKCPKILSKSRSQSLTISAPRGTRTSSPHPSSPWTLNGAGTRSTPANPYSPPPDSDPGSETFDDSGDSDDYDLDPYLGYYSPIQPVQTSMLGPTDLLNGIVNGVNTTFNSRMHSLIADFADRVTRPLFPNLFPHRQEKTIDEELSEMRDKLEKKERKSTERELNTAGDSIEETGSCSCLGDERDSIDVSDQKSTGNTDNPSVGRVNVKEVNHSEPPAEKTISDESSVGTSTTEPGPALPQLEKPKEVQSTSTQQSASGNLNQLPLVPPPPPPSGASDIASSGTNNRLDTLTTPPPVGTEEKSKTPLDGDNGSSSTTPNQEQKPMGQNSVGIGTITDQRQLPIGAQVSVMVENVQEKPKTPPFKPVDHVSVVQLPGTFVGASGPIDPSTDNHRALIQGPGSKGTDPPDGKKKERLNSLGQAGGKTDTNQQNFDPFDYILPVTLIGLGFLLFVGVVKSFGDQNNDKQPESRKEVDKNVDSNLANEEKKPPPTLYSIQPQGEAAGTLIF